MRWYVWSYNTLIFLFFSALIGPLGIKALFSVNSYYIGYTCNPDTGEVKLNQK